MYKIQLQKVNKKNIFNFRKYISYEIDADRFECHATEVELDDDTINICEKYNIRYSLVDKKFYGPLEKISFYKDNYVVDVVHILGDPYFKLFKKINNSWKLVIKHENSFNIKDHRDKYIESNKQN